MGYTVHWDSDNPQTLWMSLIGESTWVQYQSAIDRVIQEIQQVTYDVSVVIQCNHTRLAGTPFPTIKRMISLFLQLENVAQVVYIDHSLSIVQHLVELNVRRVAYRELKRFHFTNSIINARQIVASTHPDSAYQS